MGGPAWDATVRALLRCTPGPWIRMSAVVGWMGDNICTMREDRVGDVCNPKTRG
jgi:hypothetical protein